MIKAHMTDGWIHQIAFLVKENKVCSTEIEKIKFISMGKALTDLITWNSMIKVNNRLKAKLEELQKTWVYDGKD